MKLNKDWHLTHPMAKNPTLNQRILWHIEHSKNCNCRPMPENLKMEIAQRELK